MQQKIDNGINTTAAADCTAPVWPMSLTPPSPGKIRLLRCGLSSEFFAHLFLEADVLTVVIQRNKKSD